MITRFLLVLERGTRHARGKREREREVEIERLGGRKKEEEWEGISQDDSF